VAYRKVPGVAADRSRASDPAGLAADIGALHRIAPSRISPTPDGSEHEPWSELWTGPAAVADLARPLLAEPYNVSLHDRQAALRSLIGG
jgi:hypothetical protein